MNGTGPSLRSEWRDAHAANVFIRDWAERLTNRMQLTSDGNKAYVDAVERAFSNDNTGWPRSRPQPAATGPRSALETTVGTVTGYR
jgi:hypothetical protein